jgi:hypothetical protein
VNLLNAVTPGRPFHTATNRAMGHACVISVNSSMVLNRAAPVAFCLGSAPVTLFSLLMMNVFTLLLLPLVVVRTFITPGSAEGKFNLAVAPAAAPAWETVVEMGITSAGLGLRRTNGGMMKTYVRPPARKLNR